MRGTVAKRLRKQAIIIAIQRKTPMQVQAIYKKLKKQYMEIKRWT